MDGLTTHAPMTHLLRERGVFDRHPFVLIDVGCSGGIDDAWRAFGPSLVAHGYDTDVAECERLQAGEPFDDVVYHARHIGLSGSHPFAQRRRNDATRWPNTNIWGRITAGYLAERAQRTAPAGPAVPETTAVIGVDDIVRTESLGTVDFLKVDVDGPDFEVLESARSVLAPSRVLGVGMEVNWFGTTNPTEHTFHNTDRFLREQGFTLFGLTTRRYSRIDLPAPFAREAYAFTRFGQPYQGDAVYIRDLAADRAAELAADYPPDGLIKLACIYELAGLPDCAAEVLNRFKPRLREFGNLEPLLDALTPPLLGEQLSYREYIARFQRAPELFLPSAAGQVVPPGGPRAAAGARDAGGLSRRASARRSSRRLRQPIRRALNVVEDLRHTEGDRSDLAVHARAAFLEHSPEGMLQFVAGRLAKGRPLELDPGWRFRMPGDDERRLTTLKREIWSHYREAGTDAPVVFRWYDNLRLYLHLGNDLSLCLFVLGAFEPNEFMFLKSFLAPGMVALDGGANEGLFTLYAARRVSPGGAVIAVEPSTRKLGRLKANISLNRLENVTTLEVALGSRPGAAVRAVAQPGHAGMNALDPQASAQATPDRTVSKEAVSVETIDQITVQSRLERLDLIKLDIEGSEVDALAAARQTISRLGPVILLKAEEARLASQGRTKRDLVRTLDELGYELWVFDARSAQLRRAELPGEPEGNAVAAPRGWGPPVLG